MRQSIASTYDSEKTGKPYTIKTTVNGCFISEHPLADPFVRHRITIGWQDLLRALFSKGKAVVEVSIDADRRLVEDIMELDEQYLGRHDSTRRLGWNQHMEGRLSAIAGDGD